MAVEKAMASSSLVEVKDRILGFKHVPGLPRRESGRGSTPGFFKGRKGKSPGI